MRLYKQNYLIFKKYTINFFKTNKNCLISKTFYIQKKIKTKNIKLFKIKI